MMYILLKRLFKMIFTKHIIQDYVYSIKNII